MNASNKFNLSLNHLNCLLRILFSAIFILSAIGKLIDSYFTTQIIHQLFKLPLFASHITVILLLVLELIISVLVWKKQIPKMLLAVPVLFLIATLVSYRNRINCGCFGSLPFLGQMPFGAHLLLIAGILLGLLYLTIVSEHENELRADNQKENQPIDKTSKSLTLIGYTALAMMLLAFITLPFSAQNNNVINSPNNFNFVDRIFVEKVISDENTIIIDARPEFQYSMGHIPQSLNIPYNTTRLDSLIQRLSLTKKLLVLYCSNSHCNAAEILAKKLFARGCQKIRIYQGGWEDWVHHEKIALKQGVSK